MSQFFSEIFKAALSHAGSETQVKVDAKVTESNEERVQVALQARDIPQEPVPTVETAPALQRDCVWPLGEIQQLIDDILPN